MHTVFALLCFVVVIHWLIFPYPSGLLHWHCGNLTIATMPAKQPWWIWINTSCEFIMNDCITTTKQSTTKPCAYFLGYTVSTVLRGPCEVLPLILSYGAGIIIWLPLYDYSDAIKMNKSWIRSHGIRVALVKPNTLQGIPSKYYVTETGAYKRHENMKRFFFLIKCWSVFYFKSTVFSRISTTVMRIERFP